MDHGERDHAILGASGSSRWLNCPPSARAEEEVPNETSSYAAEGTLAHEISEIILRQRLGIIDLQKGIELLAEKEKNPLYSPEMGGHVIDYCDYVIEEYNAVLRDHPEAKIFIEESLDLREYIPEGFGTGDVNIVGDDLLVVIDLKFGQGVKISAQDNSQLSIYGLGSYLKHELSYDIKRLKFVIHQPRLDNISVRTLTVEELLKWAEEELRPGALLAYEGGGERKAGSWCKFCRVKVHCRAMQELTQQGARAAFKDPDTLDDSEVLEAYKNANVVANWFAAVEKHILKTALNGKKWAGLKVIHGRSTRTLDSEKAIEKLVELKYKEEQYLNKKLKGLSDLEKLLTKPVFNDVLGPLTTKPKGGPTLVDEKTAGEEYLKDAGGVFNDGFQDNE